MSMTSCRSKGVRGLPGRGSGRHPQYDIMRPSLPVTLRLPCRPSARRRRPPQSQGTQHAIVGIARNVLITFQSNRDPNFLHFSTCLKFKRFASVLDVSGFSLPKLGTNGNIQEVQGPTRKLQPAVATRSYKHSAKFLSE